MKILTRALQFGLALALAGLAVSPAWAQFALLPQFSADLMLTRPGHPAVQGRLYSGGDRWRLDIASQGREGGMIFNLQSHTVYVLVPLQKLYMEVRDSGTGAGPLSLPDIRPADPSNPCASALWTNCRKLGSEVINGRTCDNWQFNTGMTTRVGCLDQRIRVFIRTTGADGRVAELRNIREKAQPQSLFEIPAGYHKMEPSRTQPPQ
jgi:hypothetical protein